MVSLFIVLVQLLLSVPGAASRAVDEISKGIFAASLPSHAISNSSTPRTSTTANADSVSAAAVGSDSFLVSNSLLRQVVTLDSAFNYNTAFGLETFLQYVSDVVCAALDALGRLRSSKKGIPSSRLVDDSDSANALYMLADVLRYSSFFGCLALATQDDAIDILRFGTDASVHFKTYCWRNFVCTLVRIGNPTAVRGLLPVNISQTQDCRFAYSFLLQFLDHESDFELVLSESIPSLMLLATRTVHELTSDTRDAYRAFNEARTKLSVNSFSCMLNYAVSSNMMRTFGSDLPTVIAEKFASFKLPPLAKWSYVFSDETFIPEGEEIKEVNLNRLNEVLVINLDILMVTLERELTMLSSFEVDSLKLLVDKLIQDKITTIFHSLATTLLLLDACKRSASTTVYRILQQKVYQTFWFVLSLKNFSPSFTKTGWLLLINIAFDICYDNLAVSDLFGNLLVNLVERDLGILERKSILTLLSKFATNFACLALISNLGISTHKLNHLDLVVFHSEVSKLLGVQKSQISLVPLKRNN